MLNRFRRRDEFVFVHLDKPMWRSKRKSRVIKRRISIPLTLSISDFPEISFRMSIFCFLDSYVENCINYWKSIIMPHLHIYWLTSRIFVFAFKRGDRLETQQPSQTFIPFKKNMYLQNASSTFGPNPNSVRWVEVGSSAQGRHPNLSTPTQTMGRTRLPKYKAPIITEGAGLGRPIRLNNHQLSA